MSSANIEKKCERTKEICGFSKKMFVDMIFKWQKNHAFSSGTVAIRDSAYELWKHPWSAEQACGQWGKTTAPIQCTGSNYQTNLVLINESRLYSLIISSKPSAAMWTMRTKGVAKCDTLGGTQKLTFINESGHYGLTLSLNPPATMWAQRSNGVTNRYPIGRRQKVIFINKGRPDSGLPWR